MKAIICLIAIYFLSFYASSAQTTSCLFDQLDVGDTIKIHISCCTDNRISLAEDISLIKSDSGYFAIIVTDLYLRTDTLITLSSPQIDSVRNYQNMLICGKIITNFKNLHRLSLYHTLEYNGLIIKRATCVGEEYSLAYALLRY